MSVEYYVEQLQYIADYKNVLPEYLERQLDIIMHRLFVENEIRKASFTQREVLFQIIKNMNINIEFLNINF